MKLFLSNLKNAMSNILFGTPDVQVSENTINASVKDNETATRILKTLWKNRKNNFEIGDRVRQIFTNDEFGFNDPHEPKFDNAVVVDKSWQFGVGRMVGIEQDKKYIEISVKLLEKVE